MMIEKGSDMRGSIRVFVGLIITMGAAGGLDVAPDADLLSVLALAVVGMGLMVSGVMAMNRK